MSKNYLIFTDMPESYYPVWRQELIDCFSPVRSEGKHKGIIDTQIRLTNWRVYDQDEKAFLEKLKTYNNLDHDGGAHRAWRPFLNRILRFLRGLFGLGVVPLTHGNPINTPGHVVILACLPDRKDKGSEMR